MSERAREQLMNRIQTSRLDGTTLVGRAGEHVVLTDRRLADGGNELGCTSGELMLLAVGSCVVGSVNLVAERYDANIEDLSADVQFEEVPGNGYGAITVDVQIRGEVPEKTLDALREAAGSGRLTGRLRHNSEVRIAVSCVPGSRKKPLTTDSQPVRHQNIWDH